MGLGNPKVGIVGGTGRMGSWFAEFLENQGLEVMRSGRTTVLRPEKMATKCDVVVISVPIKDTMDVIKKVGPFVCSEGLLVDLTSIKSGAITAMLKHSQAQVVGLHPLFGPKNNADSDTKRIAVCPARGNRGYQWVMDITTRGGLEPLVIDPSLHDQFMGIVQGANHFAVIALALCIKDSGYSLDDLLGCSTQTFDQFIKRIRSMLKQSPHLFASLLLDNPYSKSHFNSYVASCQRLATMLNKGQREDFEKLFCSLRQFFQIEEEML